MAASSCVRGPLMNLQTLVDDVTDSKPVSQSSSAPLLYLKEVRCNVVSILSYSTRRTRGARVLCIYSVEPWLNVVISLQRYRADQPTRDRLLCLTQLSLSEGPYPLASKLLHSCFFTRGVLPSICWVIERGSWLSDPCLLYWCFV